MSECKHWDEHTGKCLDGNNMNYGHSCYSLPSYPCFSACESYPEMPCFWSNEHGICENKLVTVCGKECNYCTAYSPARLRKIEENDQTAKADAGKPRLTLVPRKIIWAIAAVREFAVRSKYYDPDNWKRVEPERYRDALYRHFMAYLDDPSGKDPESGLPILWHIATNVAFLVELESENGNEV